MSSNEDYKIYLHNRSFLTKVIIKIFNMEKFEQGDGF